MPEIVFVTQRKEDGSCSFGYHSQWDPAKENRDLVEEARKIRELNAADLRGSEFTAFFVHRQQYTQATEGKKSENQEGGGQGGDNRGVFIRATEPERIEGV